ncbi:MAG: TetR/AcrR family transcriptional regulator [Bacteroidales bacterium]|nr:TetR/AcrR family transcriptional regulator [Bacteroidales bacterium]
MANNSKHTKVKEQIIEVSSIMFAKYGYKKTTIEDIGTATGKGKTAIYYYFKNKEEIFKAIIEKEAEELENNIIKSVNNYKLPDEKLRAYIITRMQTMKNLSNFYTAIKTELYEHLPFINEIRKNVDEKEFEIIKEILEEGKKLSFFEFENVNETATTILTILKGLEIPLFVEDRINELENYINNFIKILFYGICKK